MDYNDNAHCIDLISSLVGSMFFLFFYPGKAKHLPLVLL